MTSWVGTVTYMSPERISGKKYYTDTDLWSLGILLLECAIGRFPYPDPDDTSVKELGFWELMQYITKKPSPSLPKEGFTEEFQDFIKTLLNKEAGKRSNARQLLEHPWVSQYAAGDKKYLRRWLKSLNQDGK